MHPSMVAVGNLTSSAASTSTAAMITAAVADVMSDMEAAGNMPEEVLYEECFESDGFVKFQSTVDDILLAASTASTVFNFLVIYCACKLFKKSGDTMHLFILNMTLGDLLLTIFCHPNEFLIRRHDFLKHIHLCAVIHFCNWLGLAVSGLSLTLLNVDKLIFFCWPFTYNRAMSKRLAMTDTKKHYYELFMVFFCVFPVTSSLVVSTFLFRLIKAKQHAPAPLTTDGSHVDMKREFKNKTKSLVFIFATTLWTSFSLLPYRIFNICRIHLLDWHSIDCQQRELMNWLAWILIYLLTLNPIVNPIITAIVYAPYRKALRYRIEFGSHLSLMRFCHIPFRMPC